MFHLSIMSKDFNDKIIGSYDSIEEAKAELAELKDIYFMDLHRNPSFIYIVDDNNHIFIEEE